MCLSCAAIHATKQARWPVISSAGQMQLQQACEGGKRSSAGWLALTANAFTKATPPGCMLCFCLACLLLANTPGSASHKPPSLPYACIAASHLVQSCWPVNRSHFCRMLLQASGSYIAEAAAGRLGCLCECQYHPHQVCYPYDASTANLQCDWKRSWRTSRQQGVQHKGGKGWGMRGKDARLQLPNAADSLQDSPKVALRQQAAVVCHATQNVTAQRLQRLLHLLCRQAPDKRPAAHSCLQPLSKCRSRLSSPVSRCCDVHLQISHAC